MGPAYEVEVVLVQELGDNLGSECEGDAPVILTPAHRVLHRIPFSTTGQRCCFGQCSRSTLSWLSWIRNRIGKADTDPEARKLAKINKKRISRILKTLNRHNCTYLPYVGSVFDQSIFFM
jgi:hypothetical protein